MADSIVRIQSTTSGDTAIDNSAVSVAGTSARRERIVLGDDNSATGLAPVSSSGGLLVSLALGTLTSLSCGTVYQGTLPWSTLAATSGGAQPVQVQNGQISVLAATSGGSLPVSIQNALVSVLAATSGGSLPVSIQNALITVVSSTTGGAIAVTVSSISSATVFQGTSPWSTLSATSGGSQPVSVQNALLVVVSSTTGGAIAVASHAVTQGTSPWVTQAATSGGAQPVVQSSTPWTVVSSTTGGAQPVVQSATPWTVVSSTTGGAVAVSTITSLTSATVFQGTPVWTVVSSTTGGSDYAIARASQPAALADGAVGAATIDTKGRLIVTPFQVRQLVTAKYLQVAASGETVLLASSSGFYRDLLFLCITPATSNTVSSPVTIKDSSGGATQFLLNIPSGGTTALSATVLDLPVPWPQSTATSTGNAWTVNFSIAGVYNISAIFSTWTS